jgi:hypothetical protein
LALATLFCVAIAISGCSKSTDDLGKEFDGIVGGMTLEDVEARLGSGQQMTYDQLPRLYRTILFPKVEGPTYRKWAREAGTKKATLYAAFKDGKLSGNPSIEKLDQGTVRVDWS